MNRQDLERLLVEAIPPWQKSKEGEAVDDWLEREQIENEVWDSVGNSIWMIVGENLTSAYVDDDPQKAISGIIAGFQLAFYVGWECAKEYAPRRDMSRGE